MTPVMNSIAPPELFDKWYRFTAWLGQHGGDIAIAIAIGLGIVAVLVGLRMFACRLLGGDAAIGRRKVAEGVVARTHLVFIVMIAVKLVAVQVDLPAQVTGLINVLFVIAAALQVAIWVRALILGSIERRIGSSDEHGALGTAIGLIRVLVSVAAFLIAGIVILDNVGVNVTGLIAGLGIGGIAIGLAAQGIFKDLFAALSIIFDRPFRKGDLVAIGGNNGVTGTIENIGLRTTRLRALDGEQVAIGNDKLLQDRIHNFTMRLQRRVATTIRVEPHTSPATLARLPGELQAIVDRQDHVLFDRAHITRFSPEGVEIELVYKIDSGDMAPFAEARQAIVLAVLKRMEELGVEISPAQSVSITAAPVAPTDER